MAVRTRFTDFGNFCSRPLMVGGLKHCTHCKSAFYCNKSGQSKHWKDHSALCKAIEVLDSQHSEMVRNAGVYTSPPGSMKELLSW